MYRNAMNSTAVRVKLILNFYLSSPYMVAGFGELYIIFFHRSETEQQVTQLQIDKSLFFDNDNHKRQDESRFVRVRNGSRVSEVKLSY